MSVIANVRVTFPLVRAVGFHVILHVGAVLSTVIAELVFVAAAFHAASFTLFVGKVNVTVPFTLAFAV